MSQIKMWRKGRGHQRSNIQKEKRAVFLDFLAVLWIRIRSFFGVSATDANTLSGHSSGFESKTGSDLKGTVSRDFLLLVFFMNQFPPSPRVSY
jgi:hypothetical protein